MAREAVRLERHADGVAVLTLDQPERRNAMTAALLCDFADAVVELRGDRALRVLVVTRAGKPLCSGTDLRDPPEGGADLPPSLAFREQVRQAYAAFLTLVDLEVPTIAAVGGAAIGGGLGLALLCDLRVVAADARLGAPFAALGIHAGMAITP